jgi:hypothetical protein
MISSSQARSLPLPRRYERFLDHLAEQAGSNVDGKHIWRVQHAWPWLPTGRIAEAAARVWVVRSVSTEGRLYHVHLDSGRCFYFDSGIERDCPDRTYNGKPFCCHYLAAQKAELNMFGGKANEIFEATQEAA